MEPECNLFNIHVTLNFMSLAENETLVARGKDGGAKPVVFNWGYAKTP
jgi:hypothetical protein